MGSAKAADKAPAKEAKKAKMPEQKHSFNLLPAYAVLALVTLAAEFATVPVFLHVLITTTTLIYIGAHQSVHNNSEGGEGMEQMSSKDVYMFPLIGSAFLVSIYLVFKYLPKEYVNLAIKFYFVAIGVLVVGATLSKLFEQLVHSAHVDALKKPLARVRIPLVSPDVEEGGAEFTKSGEKNDGKTDVSTLDLAGAFVAVLIVAWWAVSGHWAANNLLGFAFSIQGIEFLSLGSYFNGAALLSLLFCYDVWWVFGTDVMVTVAKSLDGPIKLLYVRGAGEAPSLLGLGDIVIPGIFVALLLRFDVHQARSRGAPLVRRYFTWVMGGYVIGIATTLGIMYYFKAAQPALLYLVPGCLISSLLSAALKGEVRELTTFEEDEGEDEKKKKEEEEKAKKDE